MDGVSEASRIPNATFANRSIGSGFDLPVQMAQNAVVDVARELVKLPNGTQLVRDGSNIYLRLPPPGGPMAPPSLAQGVAGAALAGLASLFSVSSGETLAAKLQGKLRAYVTHADVQQAGMALSKVPDLPQRNIDKNWNADQVSSFIVGMSALNQGHNRGLITQQEMRAAAHDLYQLAGNLGNNSPAQGPSAPAPSEPVIRRNPPAQASQPPQSAPITTAPAAPARPADAQMLSEFVNTALPNGTDTSRGLLYETLNDTRGQRTGPALEGWLRGMNGETAQNVYSKAHATLVNEMFGAFGLGGNEAASLQNAIRGRWQNDVGAGKRPGAAADPFTDLTRFTEALAGSVGGQGTPDAGKIRGVLADIFKDAGLDRFLPQQARPAPAAAPIAAQAQSYSDQQVFQANAKALLGENSPHLRLGEQVIREAAGGRTGAELSNWIQNLDGGAVAALGVSVGRELLGETVGAKLGLNGSETSALAEAARNRWGQDLHAGLRPNAEGGKLLNDYLSFAGALQGSIRQGNEIPENSVLGDIMKEAGLGRFLPQTAPAAPAAPATTTKPADLVPSPAEPITPVPRPTPAPPPPEPSVPSGDAPGTLRIPGQGGTAASQAAEEVAPQTETSGAGGTGGPTKTAVGSTDGPDGEDDGEGEPDSNALEQWMNASKSNWEALRGNAAQRAQEFRSLIGGTIKTVGTGFAVTNALGVAGGGIFYGGMQETRTSHPVTPENAFDELAKLQAGPLKYLGENYDNAFAGISVGDHLYNMSGNLLEMKNPDGSLYHFRRVPEDLFLALKDAQKARGVDSDQVFVNEQIKRDDGRTENIWVEIRPPFRAEPLRDAQITGAFAEDSKVHSFAFRGNMQFGPPEGQNINLGADLNFNYRNQTPTVTSARLGLRPTGAASENIGFGIRQQNTTLWNRAGVSATALDINPYQVKDLTDPDSPFNNSRLVIANARMYLDMGNRDRIRLDVTGTGDSLGPGDIGTGYARARQTGFAELGLGGVFLSFTRDDKFISLNFYNELQAYGPDLRSQRNFFGTEEGFKPNSAGSGLKPIPPLFEVDPAIQLSTNMVPRITPEAPGLTADPLRLQDPQVLRPGVTDNRVETNLPEKGVPATIGELQVRAGQGDSLPRAARIHEEGTDKTEMKLYGGTPATLATLDDRQYLVADGSVFDVTGSKPSDLITMRLHPATSSGPAELRTIGNFDLPALAQGRGPDGEAVIAEAQERGSRLTVPAGQVFMADFGENRYAALRRADASVEVYDITGYGQNTIEDFFSNKR